MEKVYDQEIRQTLEERFEFQYPCYYLAGMPVKVSVSELEKRSWQDEEQEETVVFSEGICTAGSTVCSRRADCPGERQRELPIIRLWNVWIIQEIIPLRESESRSAGWKKWEK